ncbi:MAG TPA: alpha/beta hydrolase [Ktedonobacterales bacterium]|nr:alpha/beta hydrolase [Ktedonobacterales bacterium]
MSTDVYANRDRSAQATVTSFHVSTPTSDLVGREYAGEGQPIVLLHGGPGVPDYLEPVAALLAPRHRVITFDQRGVGASSVRSGGYSVAAYLGDLEGIRTSLGVDRLHLFGHSWGGLLGQLYAAAFPAHTGSLFLCDSSTGVGPDWKRMEGAVLRHNRRQAGLARFLIMGGRSLLALLPGPVGDRAFQRMFAQIWRNYFPDPRQAPPADPRWLAGISRSAMRLTRQAILHMDPSLLCEIAATPAFPVLVLFGGNDIYGSETRLVAARYPQAANYRLEGTVHLPWLQSPDRFASILRGFYDTVAGVAEP